MLALQLEYESREPPVEGEETEITDEDTNGVRRYAYRNGAWVPVLDSNPQKQKREYKKRSATTVFSSMSFSVSDIIDAIDSGKNELAKELLKVFNEKLGEIKLPKRAKESGGPKGEKRATAYNKFVSQELSKMKGDASIPAKERLKRAMEKWREHKVQSKVQVLGGDAAVVDAVHAHHAHHDDIEVF